MVPTMYLLLVTLTAFNFLQSVPARATKVPGVDSYVNVLGVGRFKLHTNQMEYTEAVKACAAEDSHLAVPTSKGAEDAMGQLLRAAMIHHAYVGINDLEVEGRMMTVTGKLYSEVGYSKWAWLEPNNCDKGEDCVTITGDKLLNDYPCSYKSEFFCEKNRLVPHDPY